jgi:opacity protein-like surface antigen
MKKVLALVLITSLAAASVASADVVSATNDDVVQIQNDVRASISDNTLGAFFAALFTLPAILIVGTAHVLAGK